MKIANVISGFKGQADIMRRAMGKKNVQLLEKMENDFINGADKNGVKRSPSVCGT